MRPALRVSSPRRTPTGIEADHDRNKQLSYMVLALGLVFLALSKKFAACHRLRFYNGKRPKRLTLD